MIGRAVTVLSSLLRARQVPRHAGARIYDLTCASSTGIERILDACPQGWSFFRVTLISRVAIEFTEIVDDEGSGDRGV